MTVDDRHPVGAGVRPLLPSGGGGAAIAVAGTSALCAGVVGVLVHGVRGPVSVDLWVQAELPELAGSVHAVLERVVDVGSPFVALASSLWLGLLCWVTGQHRASLLPVVAVPAAVALTALVLQPLVARDSPQGGWVYPSSHMTATAALCFSALVLLRHGGVLADALPRGVRPLLAAGALAFPVLLGAALVTLRYHYATDVVGALGVAMAVGLSVAVLVDRPLGRRRDALPTAQECLGPQMSNVSRSPGCVSVLSVTRRRRNACEPE